MRIWHLILLSLFTLSAAAWAADPATEALVAAPGAQVEAPALVDSLPPAPPLDLFARDYVGDNDSGDRIILTWSLSPDDGAGADDVTSYVVMRSSSLESAGDTLDVLPAGSTEYLDATVEPGREYYYTVTARDAANESEPAVFGPAVGRASFWQPARNPIFVLMFTFFGLVLFFTRRAQRGASLFIRRIPGLNAIEEAVGRATEMGRPVLYVPGIGEIDDIMTIASLTILSHVAKITAKYETPLIVPTARAVVMSAAEEVVKEAYAEAGRPDAYNPDNVRYLSDAQFAFAGAVNGIMLRERPAANLYLGAFWAESLLLAETGFEAGAIQVAGTAMVSQLPFFVTACDFTLMGEELYAASAYLSREPKLLGSLKGSDWMKVVSIILMAFGIILNLLNLPGFAEWFNTQ